jgi:nucleoside-diphosphate-sugar epimerase
MRALVTGATGFVGSALCLRLDGHEVTAFVRSPGELAERRIAVDHIVEVRSRTERLSSRRSEAPRSCSASRPPSASPRLSDESRAVHVGGTRNLLEAARQHGVRRVVPCSTVGIHGLAELRR